MSIRKRHDTSASGNRWTPEEEAQLVDALGKYKDICTIATDHKRTPGGVWSHMCKMAVRMMETEEKSIVEFCEILVMRMDDVEELLEAKLLKE